MSVQPWQFFPDQLVQDEIPEMVLWHTIVKEWNELFVHDQGHENVEGELLIFKVAEEASCHVVHALAVADFRQDVGYGLEDLEELLRLLL